MDTSAPGLAPTQPSEAPRGATPRSLRTATAQQGRLGVASAMLVLLAWGSAQYLSHVWWRWSAISALFAPVWIACISWLCVGLFIVAHDSMHGSLAPHSPRLTRWIGALCLFLYAGLDFDFVTAKHVLHHRAPGTRADPDFHPDNTAPAFWSWYAGFLYRYTTWRQLLRISLVFQAALWLAGIPLENLLAFWALPTLLSSLQLFYFGTYLPHRPTREPFEDAHRARSSAYPDWLSLLSCFHFGYHLEHHRQPELPWWRLPRARRRTPSAQGR